MLRLGSLFSGYGGLDLAVHEAFGAETVWVSDIIARDKKGAQVGDAPRILAHRFPGVPNLGDITAVDWSQVEPVDIIAGGSPCQDISTAGKRAGMTEGTRSNLWVTMREAIAALQPAYVVWENVSGALSARADSAMESDPRLLGDRTGRPSLRALGRVLGDLADLGFDAEWVSLRASDVGCCHGRRRVFVVAAHPQRVARLQRWQPAAWEAVERRALSAATRRGGASELVRLDRQDLQLYRAVVGEDLGQPGAQGVQQVGRDGFVDGGANGDGVHGGKASRRLTDVNLLPTPAAMAPNDGESPSTWLARRERVRATASNGNGMGMPLSIAVQLLPTPSANEDGYRVGGDSQQSRSLSGLAARGDLLPTPSVADAQGGHERRGGQRGDELLLKGIASHERFGQYAAAIARQERATGYPAPDPTEPGKTRPRLSARFAEWMMGLPPGWITDVPGMRRNWQLHAIGNGVVPQQAAAAIRHCLHRMERAA